VLNNIKT